MQSNFWAGTNNLDLRKTFWGLCEKSDHCLSSTKIWVKFYHFWPKYNDEKYMECNNLISPLHFYFLHKIANSPVTKITFFEHGGISKEILMVYVNMICETLSQKFHSYSILTV